MLTISNKKISNNVFKILLVFFLKIRKSKKTKMLIPKATIAPLVAVKNKTTKLKIKRKKAKIFQTFFFCQYINMPAKKICIKEYTPRKSGFPKVALILAAPSFSKKDNPIFWPKP